MSMAITVAGFVPQDPENKKSKNGNNMTIFSVCAYGTKKDPVYWRVIVMGEILGPAMSMISKGSSVMVTGQFSKPRCRMAQSGEPVADLSMFASQITLLPKGDPGGQGNRSYKTSESLLQKQLSPKLEEEDLPF